MDDEIKNISAADGAADSLEDVRKRNAELLRKFINEKPVLLVKLVCESILGIPSDGGNPFMVKSDDSSEIGRNLLESSRRFNGGFARLILDKIRDEEIGKPDSDSEYIPFSEVVKDWFHGVFKWLKADDLGEISDVFSLNHAIFEKYSGNLGAAIDSAAYLVYEGVPLYKEGADGNINRLPHDDPLHIYVFKKGEFWETGKITSFPEWIDGLYFKRSDLDVHDLYFSGSGELTEEARATRRQAMWQTLGVKGNSSQPGDVQRREHRTKLTDAVQAVIDRYYGSGYKANDLSTVTSQKIVIEWLQATYGMSEREAQAVDIVTRPDSSRRR